MPSKTPKKLKDFATKRFSRIVKELIEFHSGRTTLPIGAQSWEELIWATLAFMYGQDKVDWDPQSHEKSVDVRVKIGKRTLAISAKAGVVKNDTLSISSYRLTTFDNLKEKLQFIEKQHNTFDSYLICARKITKTSRTYSVIKTTPQKMAPQWLVDPKNWVKMKTGYELKSKFDFSAKIVSKMSEQLWYSIPLNYFSQAEILVTISVQNKDLGRGLLDFLQEKFSQNT
ncbi:MAG: hypothetical protein KJI69_00520 [Patescibacteria group bacterium]|nr:hypothetical protein [Patescibacteria group bacterium]